jgi:hypothetical protein
LVEAIEMTENADHQPNASFDLPKQLNTARSPEVQANVT